MRRPYIALALVVLLALVFGWFVWPTRYEYLIDPKVEGRYTTLYRIDRITGRVFIFHVSEGWVEQI